MAWPPPVPPFNRTNTTPQADNHPADHNQISSALSDIINRITSDEGVTTETNRRVGVGLVCNSMLFGASGSGTEYQTITWDAEAYDTDGFHTPPSTDIIVPASGLNRDGHFVPQAVAGAVYAVTFQMFTSSGVGRNSLVRLGFPAIGPNAYREATITEGNQSANVCYVGPMGAGFSIRCAFWNGGPGPIYAGGSVELLRVAP